MPTLCSTNQYINDDISAGLEVSVEECLDFIEDKSKRGAAKSPFIYEICQCEEFCSENIDLVIVPIRDPGIATMSRLINEIKTISFDSESSSLMQSFGRVDAGNHYFLDGFEEMRCLSSGLSLLLYECTKKNIKLSFTPFPEIGDEKVANRWAQSIEPFTIQFGIDANQIADWITDNFDNDRIQQYNGNDMEAFKTYLNTTRESIINAQSSSTTGFIKAHNKYLRKSKSEIEKIRAEADQARNEAEQAKTEAEQAKTEAEQAKTEAEQARADVENIKNSRFWKITRPARSLIDLLKNHYD